MSQLRFSGTKMQKNRIFLVETREQTWITKQNSNHSIWKRIIQQVTGFVGFRYRGNLEHVFGEDYNRDRTKGSARTSTKIYRNSNNFFYENYYFSIKSTTKSVANFQWKVLQNWRYIFYDNYYWISSIFSMNITAESLTNFLWKWLQNL